MLFLNSSLTHLGAASMKLLITAQDGDGLSSARPAEVTINVVQSGQAPAVFQRSRYAFTVPEDAPLGTSVGTVEASNLSGEWRRKHQVSVSSSNQITLTLVHAEHPITHTGQQYCIAFSVNCICDVHLILHDL